LCQEEDRREWTKCTDPVKKKKIKAYNKENSIPPGWGHKMKCEEKDFKKNAGWGGRGGGGCFSFKKGVYIQLLKIKERIRESETWEKGKENEGICFKNETPKSPT